MLEQATNRRTIIRKALVVTLVTLLAISVSACGRKNSPVPPEDSTYPQDYPTE